jgi:hypothetical protein
MHSQRPTWARFHVGPEQVLEYLGRYTHRSAISNERPLQDATSAQGAQNGRGITSVISYETPRERLSERLVVPDDVREL